MKKRVIFWVAAAAVVAAAFRFTFAASADILTVVDLTREQTLALYGTHLTGQYFTGSEWKTCTFEYFDPPRVDASPYVTDIIDTYNTGYTSQQIDSLLRNNEFLFYRCPIGDLVPPPVSSGHYIQFNLDFSVSIQGIAYFRQIVGMGTREQTSSGGVSSSLRPYADMFYVSSNVSYSPAPVVSYGAGSYQNELTAWFSCPLGWDNEPLVVAGRNVFDNIGKFFFADCYLQDIDNTTGQENTFSLSGQQFTFNYAQTYELPVSPDSYTDENVRMYYVIALSTPRVTDGYILPDVPTTAPDYSGQLDDILQQGAANQTILQQILTKLDLIYQKNYTVNVDTSGIVSGVVNGIRDLFVPTQSDLMNFRLSMMTLCNDTLSPFYDVEQLRDTAINRITAAPVVDYVDLPLLDLTGAGIPFALTAADFPNYEVIDNNVRVPLRLSSDWDFFYNLVAWGLDVVCTLAFVNMVINKIHALYLGDKVVEIDGN